MVHVCKLISLFEPFKTGQTKMYVAVQEFVNYFTEQCLEFNMRYFYIVNGYFNQNKLRMISIHLHIILFREYKLFIIPNFSSV